MSGQQPAFPESLDEILSVVKETPRGRWFLDEYTNRVQTTGTSTILSAISKLETSLQSMSGSGADAKLLQRARQHIAQARADIAGSAQNKDVLSSEGQLFAKLAELSRKAFSEPSADQPSVAKNIERALRLVAELDQDLGTSLVPMPVAEQKPPAQYFKQDEDVFEPAPAAPLVRQIKPQKPIESISRGAKLVIKHIELSKPDATVSMAQLETPPVVIEPPVLMETEPAAPLEISEPSRIVIIRRKAEDMAELPLTEEQPLETVTAA